jgi:multidrug efflux pump subunit AcrB
MSIVETALRRPFTFIVMAILIVILGLATINSTPTDVFPVIDIPVATVIWNYTGMSPNDMEKRIVTISERAYATSVNDIEHIESQSTLGVSSIKIFFQPGAKIEAAISQLTATSQTVLKTLPRGIIPPLIIQYNASAVPIIQLGISSNTLSEQQLYDYADNFVRVQLATVRGQSTPSPYGGKPRRIMVDLNTQALQAKGLSAEDVASAIDAQNLILPTGTAKMGEREYIVGLNNSPQVIEELNNLPIRQINGAMIYVRDVAQVHDGFAVQRNVININGRRSVLLTVIKSGNASTLDVVDRVRVLLPRIQATAPPGVHINILSDQSFFVRASVQGVVREAVIAALLTACMVLLFLGSWRSTLIVASSIPLAILVSIIALGATGQTLNVMTLGGLALAVGILVDNAIVSIENMHRNLSMGKSLHRAILDGAEQIAAPSLVATMAICIVFVPILFLGGAAGSLFKPLALAVVYAMIASYLLSRTFVPVMVNMLLKHELHLYRQHEGEHGGHHHSHKAADAHAKDPKPDLFWRIHQVFNVFFDKLQNGYRGALNGCLHNRMAVVGGFMLFFAGSAILLPFIGQDFFPSVDAGQFRLAVRAPAGTRLEETARLFHQVENTIRKTIPAKQLDLMLNNIGLPAGQVNFAYNTSGAIGPSDGEILVTLKEGAHGPTADYIAELRKRLPEKFPQLTFFYQPADITTQILNFGLPAPIDLQVVGRDEGNCAIARQIAKQVRGVPGAADVHVQQVTNVPMMRVVVDRERAQELGLTQRNVANNLIISLSSSVQAFPNYWLDPKNGVSYLLAEQTPMSRLDSMDAILDTPIISSTNSSTKRPQELLSNIAHIERTTTAGVINHYNVRPVYDIFANVQGRDLGGVSRDISKIMANFEPKLPKGTTLTMRGQVQSMNQSFLGLGVGLLFSIVLVYLLMVVNFQSWLDPFIIITALPGALCGILWMLYVTQTTFSVPALMGAIMCVGVSTANSILVVAFANDRRAEGDDATTAAMTAGMTRLRPVLMTAAAMILGMLPMALGMGEGGEQNAPLGRAIIGGLTVATITTLLFVPVVYAMLRRKQPQAIVMEDNLPDLHPTTP